MTESGGIIAEFAFALGLVDNASKPLNEAAETAEKTAEKASASWAGAGKAIGAALAAVGAAVVGAGAGLFALADRSTATADAIAKGARNAGIASDEYQKLAHAADLSDVSAEALTRTVQTLNQQLLESANGGAQPFVDALGQIGLRAEDLGGSPTENLGKIFDALNMIPDDARRSALSIELLGRGGRQMASLIAEGSAGLNAMGEEAERLGLIIDEEALAASEAFQDSLTRMKGSLGAIARDIGISLAPAIEDVTIEVTEWAAANGEVFAEDLSGTVRNLGDALVQLLPAITAVAGALGTLAEEWRLAVDVLTLDDADFKPEDLVGADTKLEAAANRAIRLESERNTARTNRKIARDQERAEREADAKEAREIAASVTGPALSDAGLKYNKQTGKVESIKKAGGGGKRSERPVDFAAEDFEELEAEELLGEDIDRLARQVGASDAQRQEALSAAARSLAGNASVSVALKAAKSRLESLTGTTLRDKESDPILSEIFGEDVPDVQLSQLALGAQPQTLIATINNSFAFDVRQEINGAGNPAEVASQINRQMVEVWEGAVEKSTKLAKVRFRR